MCTEDLASYLFKVSLDVCLYLDVCVYLSLWTLFAYIPMPIDLELQFHVTCLEHLK